MIINTFAQIKIMNKKEYVLFGMLLFLTSCVSKKDIYYFQDIEASQYENSFKFLDIQPGDILDIQIKALNLESVKIFQKPSSFLPQQQIQNRAVDGYLVGDSGTINLPILGEIDTSNHNTQSLALSIQAALTTYIKDPTVNIRLLNFRVSVLGEVRQPGTYTFYEERISLPQVLGAANDYISFICKGTIQSAKIFNSLGALIYQSEQISKISVGVFSKGIYFIEIRLDDGQIFKDKFLKL